MLSVEVVTNIPNPYNAALFAALDQLVDLRVHFEAPATALRSWTGQFLEGYDGVVHAGTRVGRWGFWTPGLVRSLRRSADVFLFHGGYASPTIAGLLLEGPTGPARLFWGERFMTTRAANSFIRRRLLGRADSLLAIGEHAATQYRSVTRKQVHVLPYSCASGAPRREPSSGRIGFVGQIIERKGLDILFEACSRTGAPPIDVIGSGPLEDDLRQYAGSRGLDVTWHGERPNSAIAGIRAAWDLQVVPSRYDGWGVVVNEALASGTPVVVSSTAGATELVRDGVNGWIHAGGDVDSLSAALQNARVRCRDPDVRSAAAITGEVFSAKPAARFLVDVLSGSPSERSFITEQWHVAEARLRRRPEPDDGIPYPVRRDDPPPA